TARFAQTAERQRPAAHPGRGEVGAPERGIDHRAWRRDGALMALDGVVHGHPVVDQHSCRHPTMTRASTATALAPAAMTGFTSTSCTPGSTHITSLTATMISAKGPASHAGRSEERRVGKDGSRRRAAGTSEEQTA